MSQKRNERQLMLVLCCAVMGCYALAYLWANLCNRHAFNIDMYADAQVAAMMWKQKTLFPQGWVFGNQYYLFATPVLSALIYGLLGESSSVLALGLASCVMGALLLCAFVWMLRPFVRRESLAAGACAFFGAVILGVSVCRSTSGAQLLYTMASYYACYLIVFQLAVGIWLRLRSGMIVRWPTLALALLLCFLLGMQSLRETLVLALPLFIFQLLLFVFGERKRAAPAFAAAVLAVNLVGVFCARFIHAKSSPQISGFSPPSSLSVLLQNTRDAFFQFTTITGVYYRSYGSKWLPLFGLAVGICLVCAAACVLALKRAAGRKRESGDGAAVECCVGVCVLSLLAVMGVRALLGFEIRTVYFFVWYLLAALSFVLLLERVEKPWPRRALCLFLLACGAVNLFYNVYPDAVQYREQKALMEDTAQKLIDAGIDCVYVEYVPFFASAVAACSGDRIEASPVRLARDGDGYRYEAYPATVKEELFTPERKARAVLILSESVLSETSSFRELEDTPGAMEDVMGRLELMDAVSNRYAGMWIYRLLDPSVVR